MKLAPVPATESATVSLVLEHLLVNELLCLQCKTITTTALYSTYICAVNKINKPAFGSLTTKTAQVSSMPWCMAVNISLTLTYS